MLRLPWHGIPIAHSRRRPPEEKTDGPRRGATGTGNEGRAAISDLGALHGFCGVRTLRALDTRAAEEL
ncbi:hypothetical protein GCM10022226_56820 [Sphaerisporangium flaviroseum]|uniref:Uncharacterized protein n=1 Tax=Sphaerisporangium flaviroseum TaxID=509199 RepID=A0ABP7IXG9_9ACTN